MSRAWTITLALVLAGLTAAPVRADELDKYIWEAPVITADASDATKDLRDKLDAQVAAIIEAGHLAPLRLPYTEGPVFYYWLNAGDTLRALSMAIPFLSESRSAELKRYLKSELDTHGLRPLPLDKGARREGYLLPKTGPFDRPRPDANQLILQRSYLYGVWCYAYYTGDYDTAGKLVGQMASTANSIKDKSYEALSNYIAVIRLAAEAGRADIVRDLEPKVRSMLGEAGNFKDWAFEYNKRYNAVMRLRGTVYVSSCGILIDLSPEMGRFLADRAADQVRAFVDARTRAVPLWFIARGPGHVTLADPAYMAMGGGQTQDEVSTAPVYATGPIFFAKTMVLGEKPDVMRTYLDVPICPRGDLEYIEKLTALLRAHGTVQWKSVKP